MCKQVGLDQSDLDIMTIGMCLDFIEEYIEQQNPKRSNETKVRRATQEDFDAF